jgi:FkbM family methyltransferase
MQLIGSEAAPFTRWIVRTGALQSRFVLIDVGVRGGIHPRWDALGDALEVYGFDADQDAIAELPETHLRKYFTAALGEEDRECEITIPSNAYETSLFGAGVPGEKRTVRMRRLDTFFAEGLIPPADFIKLDCEGYEPQILAGASGYMDKSNLVGADIETNFNISPTLPRTHFWDSYKPLLQQRLLLDDIAFDRVPLKRFADHVKSFRHGTPPQGICRPATCNVFLGRDLVSERNSAAYIFREAEREPSAETVLKAAIVFEVYGVNDLAFHLLFEFRDILSPILDVTTAANLIAPPINLFSAVLESARVRFHNSLREPDHYA